MVLHLSKAVVPGHCGSLREVGLGSSYIGPSEGSEVNTNEIGEGSWELKDLGFYGLAKIASFHGSRISAVPVGNEGSLKLSHGFTLCCDGS